MISKLSDMVGYKVNGPDDGQEFVKTRAYRKLYGVLKDLNINKGRIIHVMGAPGTGKSATIYRVIKDLDLKVYDAPLILDNADLSSSQVIKQFFQTLVQDMEVESVEGVYKKAAHYDAVLLADRFHDSQFLYDNKKGFSIWMDKKGFRTLPFFILLIYQYFCHYGEFKGINLIFQTAWTFKIKGVKYDLFTDFGFFSTIIKLILKIFFELVEITYTDDEIVEIVKLYHPEADDVEIGKYIKKYGSRIRFILQSIS